MRKAISALGIFLGSILYAVIWIRIFYFSFNYREADESFYSVILSPLMFIVFYISGIYINATIFQFFSKREINIVPSVLLYSYVISFGLSICIPAVFGIYFWSLGISLLFVLVFHVVGLETAFHFKTNRTFKQFGKKISIVLLINLILLMYVCINDFPGINAPIEARQKWAYQKFSGYSTIVDTIERSNKITDKVGQIRFVAPTIGRNLLFRIGAGNMPLSDLTLEVVGEKGTGIAYITAVGGSTLGMSFEYQGEKTKVY